MNNSDVTDEQSGRIHCANLVQLQINCINIRNGAREL